MKEEKESSDESSEENSEEVSEKEIEKENNEETIENPQIDRYISRNLMESEGKLNITCKINSVKIVQNKKHN